VTARDIHVGRTLLSVAFDLAVDVAPSRPGKARYSVEGIPCKQYLGLYVFSMERLGRFLDRVQCLKRKPCSSRLGPWSACLFRTVASGCRQRVVIRHRNPKCVQPDPYRGLTESHQHRWLQALLLWMRVLRPDRDHHRKRGTRGMARLGCSDQPGTPVALAHREPFGCPADRGRSNTIRVRPYLFEL
jgi:hypothetical protein